MSANTKLNPPEFLSYFFKQLFGHIRQSIVGEFTVVSLITFGSSVKELARVFMCKTQVKETSVGFKILCNVIKKMLLITFDEGYYACKCSDLLCCSILEGKTCKAPFSYPVPRVHAQICTVLPVRKQNMSLGR